MRLFCAKWVVNIAQIMDMEQKNFARDLAELRKFLADRKLLGELADRAGAKSRTVQYALSVKSQQDLKGKRLKVYLEALILKKEIESFFKDYEPTQFEY